MKAAEERKTMPHSDASQGKPSKRDRRKWSYLRHGI
jgi:hypothetical protein